MIKKISFMALIILVVACKIDAQESDKQPEEVIKEFFRLAKEDKIKEATEYIFSTNKWMKNSQDQIMDVSEKLEKAVKPFGKLFGEEKIARAAAGPNLITYAYLARYDRQPLRFVFTFYKPADSWRLYFFKYDDQADDELLDAIRADRLIENYIGQGN